MKLYHGTSETVARLALTEGLVPRGEDEGNWEDAPSRPDCVYLTTAYAPYFAMAASETGEKWAIIEVDTDYLCEYSFLPDEDFLEQASRMGKGESPCPPELTTMHERTAWFREHLAGFSHYWEDSIKGLGNCAYLGEIPPEAITKITLIDPRENSLAMTAMDPSIGLMNYMICGAKYRALTKWMSGYEITVEEFDPMGAALLKMPSPPTGYEEHFKELGKALADSKGIETLKEAA